MYTKAQEIFWFVKNEAFAKTRKRQYLFGNTQKENLNSKHNKEERQMNRGSWGENFL